MKSTNRRVELSREQFSVNEKEKKKHASESRDERKYTYSRATKEENLAPHFSVPGSNL